MASAGGSITATDLTVNTTGPNGAPIATDRGGGTITANGGTYTSSGTDSPAVYSTGTITLDGVKGTATGAEAAVVEGSNSITATSSDLSGAKKWGVLVYQSMSGDATGVKGVYTQTGGSLTAAEGPLFYVTNSNATITLSGVALTAPSGVLVNAAAGSWGTSGSNGGVVVLDAKGQVLTGNVVVDAISQATIELASGSSLSGAVNAAGTAKSVTVRLDATSTWNVRGDSTVTVLDDAAGISGTSITNITGNGHTVHYSASANPTLGGKTYSLAGGGQLVPS
jgi:hypothetical protein